VGRADAIGRRRPKYVAPGARIATFDQDGTLWVSHPMYTQIVYCLERVPALVVGTAGGTKYGYAKDGRCSSRSPDSS
jgi:hypothetical protein